jgi:hypothetical protein
MAWLLLIFVEGTGAGRSWKKKGGYMVDRVGLKLQRRTYSVNVAMPQQRLLMPQQLLLRCAAAPTRLGCRAHRAVLCC